MVYGSAFFDLQLRFARTVSALYGLALERALLDYTNLYIRLGLGRDFDAAHPGWRHYLAGLNGGNDDGEWTHRCCLPRLDSAVPPGLVASVGCFGYARLHDGRIRLHFDNAEVDGHSPLALERRTHRSADLAALFTQVKRTEPTPVRVIGASWLYNLEAYRRLFPKSYLASARPLTRRFQHMPLWGQFVDRHGGVKESLARELFHRLAHCPDLEQLDACFPFEVLGVEAPAEEFYAFYEV
jgi:hypothetical protein